MKSIDEAKTRAIQVEESLISIMEKHRLEPILKKSKALEDITTDELSHRMAIYRAARFSLKGVRRLCMPGITPRLKIPNSEEIEHLLNMSNYESPFGDMLEHQITNEAGYITNGEAEEEIPHGVPKIVYYLARAILSLGGLSTAGIFRIAGNNEQLGILRRSLERGEFRILQQETGPSLKENKKKSPKKKNSFFEKENMIPLPINDAHVPATLLKAWFRELEVSLIPEQFYDVSLKAASSEAIANRIAAVKKIISSLPYSHQCTLEFLISFLRIIAGEDGGEGVNATRMNINNLAIVFGPTILRAPASLNDDPIMDIGTAFGNAKLEQAFLTTILSNPQAIFN